MQILVAGATGAVGLPAVRRLVAAGHEVSAVARDPARARQVQAAGARPVAVDLFDAEAVRGSVRGQDAVVNLATHIPSARRALLPGAWAENDRVRTQVSRNLVAAALDAGVARYLQESVVFVYPDSGAAWIDESMPVAPTAVAASALQAEAQAARVPDGVVLRFGLFYGATSSHTRDTVDLARRGFALTAGEGEDYICSIALDDAAAAVVAALDLPRGTYNVADDDPVTRREYMAALAAALGVPVPRLAPAWLGSLPAARPQARSLRVSNARIRAASAWRPAYPSVREGWPVVVRALEGVCA